MFRLNHILALQYVIAWVAVRIHGYMPVRISFSPSKGCELSVFYSRNDLGDYTYVIDSSECTNSVEIDGLPNYCWWMLFMDVPNFLKGNVEMNVRFNEISASCEHCEEAVSLVGSKEEYKYICDRYGTPVRCESQDFVSNITTNSHDLVHIVLPHCLREGELPRQLVNMTVIPRWKSIKGFNTCGEWEYGPKEGEIATPNFGLTSYPPETTCSWIIEADADEQILLTFSYFSVEAGENVYAPEDYVKIYDGETLLGTFCSHSPPGSIIVSETNLLRVFFSSDFASEGRGFSAYYRKGDYSACRSLPLKTVVLNKETNLSWEVSEASLTCLQSSNLDATEKTHAISLVHHEVGNVVISIDTSTTASDYVGYVHAQCAPFSSLFLTGDDSSLDNPKALRIPGGQENFLYTLTCSRATVIFNLIPHADDSFPPLSIHLTTVNNDVHI